MLLCLQINASVVLSGVGDVLDPILADPVHHQSARVSDPYSFYTDTDPDPAF